MKFRLLLFRSGDMASDRVRHSTQLCSTLIPLFSTIAAYLPYSTGTPYVALYEEYYRVWWLRRKKIIMLVDSLLAFSLAAFIFWFLSLLLWRLHSEILGLCTNCFSFFALFVSLKSGSDRFESTFYFCLFQRKQISLANDDGAFRWSYFVYGLKLAAHTAQIITATDLSLWRDGSNGFAVIITVWWARLRFAAWSLPYTLTRSDHSSNRKNAHCRISRLTILASS